MTYRPCLEYTCRNAAVPGQSCCRECQAQLERANWAKNPNRDPGFRRLKREVTKQLPVTCSLCGQPIAHLGHDRLSLTFDHI